MKSKSQAPPGCLSRKLRHSLLLLATPALLLIVLFNVVPMLGYLPAAFYNWIPPKTIADSQWVGLKWFQSILSYKGLEQMLKNTLILGGMDFLLLPIPLVLALACQHCGSDRIKKTVDVCALIASFLPSIIVVAITQKILSYEGLLNQFLGVFGVKPENHLLNGPLFYVYFSLSSVWSSLGFSLVVYNSCLGASSMEQHDAAKVDGANLFQRIIHIDLPLCRPMFLHYFTMCCLGILATNTDRLLLFKNTANSMYATTLDLYAYELTFKSSFLPQYSKAIALGIMTGVFNLFMLFLSRKLAKRRERIYG